MNANDLEEGTELRLDFSKLATVAQGVELIPVAVQNADSQDVILVAYVNEVALQKACRRALPRSGVPHATSSGSKAQNRATRLS
jgi:hypothetical protein